MKERGKFIVLYGSNNLGKSTQADMIIKRLKGYGLFASYLKYPVYDLGPTGPRLNDILRHHTEEISSLELQKIFAQNRRDYEPTLKGRLESGEWIVSEDYKGTGIAWGITYGVNIDTLEEINKGLFPEDVAICFDGERFVSSIERGHLYEEGGKWNLNREIHRQLTNRYGWEVVRSDMSKEKVHEEIWNKLTRRLLTQRLSQLE